jgi:hypothetical protein
MTRLYQQHHTTSPQRRPPSSFGEKKSEVYPKIEQKPSIPTTYLRYTTYERRESLLQIKQSRPLSLAALRSAIPVHSPPRSPLFINSKQANKRRKPGRREEGREAQQQGKSTERGNTGQRGEKKTACDSDDAEQGCSAAFTCACRCTRGEQVWLVLGLSTIGPAPLLFPRGYCD